MHNSRYRLNTSTHCVYMLYVCKYAQCTINLYLLYVYNLCNKGNASTITKSKTKNNQNTKFQKLYGSDNINYLLKLLIIKLYKIIYAYSEIIEQR